MTEEAAGLGTEYPDVDVRVLLADLQQCSSVLGDMLEQEQTIHASPLLACAGPVLLRSDVLKRSLAVAVTRRKHLLAEALRAHAAATLQRIEAYIHDTFVALEVGW